MLTPVSSTHLDKLIELNNKAYVVSNNQIHQYNVRTIRQTCIFIDVTVRLVSVV